MVNQDYDQRPRESLSAEQRAFLEKVSAVLLEIQTSVLEKLQKIHRLVLERLNARQGTIILLDIQSSHYLILAATHRSLVGQLKVIEPKGITAYILKNKRLFVSEENISFRGEKQKHRFRALLALPLLSKEGDVLGIFYLTGLPESTIIDEQEKALLEVVAGLLSPYFEMAFWGKKLVSVRQTHADDILADLMTLKGDLFDSVAKEEAFDLTFEEGEEGEGSRNYYPWLQQGAVRKGEKKKTTHYLRPEVYDLLNQACEQSKSLLTKKTKISRSEIVNLSLELVLTDFNRNKARSLLVQRIKDREKKRKKKT